MNVNGKIRRESGGPTPRVFFFMPLRRERDKELTEKFSQVLWSFFELLALNLEFIFSPNDLVT
jgi:hypothetical protein